MLKFNNISDFEDYALDLLKAKKYKTFSSLDSLQNNINYEKNEKYVVINKNRTNLSISVYSKQNCTFVYCDNNINVPSYISLYYYLGYYYINSIFYMVKGKYHRPFQPAILIFNNQGLKSESYYLNGRLHNSVAPAYRNKENNIWSYCFYLNGKYFSKNEFFRNRKDINF